MKAVFYCVCYVDVLCFLYTVILLLSLHGVSFGM